MFISKFMEDAVYGGNLFRRLGYNNDMLIGNTFPFAVCQNLLGPSSGIEQLSTQTVSGPPAQLVSELRKPEKPRSDLYRKLAAVFSRHCPLQSLHDRSRHAVIITEQLCTVVNWNAGGLAEIFVVCRLVHILKAPPTAHVVDQNRGKL